MGFVGALCCLTLPPHPPPLLGTARRAPGGACGKGPAANSKFERAQEVGALSIEMYLFYACFIYVVMYVQVFFLVGSSNKIFVGLRWFVENGQCFQSFREMLKDTHKCSIHACCWLLFGAHVSATFFYAFLCFQPSQNG